MTGTVAIVGRPNVGKSSLFNRLLGKRVAIVDPTPGVTRDRIEGFVNWRGKNFRIIDTGGMDFDSAVSIKQEIQRQVDMALGQADVLLFLVDASEGLMPLDAEIMKKLRPLGKPMVVAANKSDTGKGESGAAAFYQMGMDKIYPVSALHGRGVGELLDELGKLVPETSVAPAVTDVRIAILGKPNVGKSSFVNTVLNEDRMVVDNKPGTTRDAVDVRITHGGKNIILVDTAGIKRSKQWESAPEFYSVSRAKNSVQRADVVILVLDAMEGVSQQDRKLASLVQEEGKPMVICLNKWDLVHGVDTRKYAEAFFEQIPFARYAPLVYASALQNKNVDRCLDEALAVRAEAGRTIPTKALNKVFEKIQERQPHPMIKGKRFKIFFVSQTGTFPPVITLFVNNKDLLNVSYLQYVENKLREEFGFTGVPLRFAFRNRRD